MVLNKSNTTVFALKNTKVLNGEMSLKDRLRQSRKNARLSQEELADKVGCTQGLISKIERGDQTETALIVEIAAALNVRPEYLLCKDDYETLQASKELLADQVNGNYELKRSEPARNTVPVFDLIQAGDYKNTFANLGQCDIALTDATIKKHTFAIVVTGDSMTPVFMPGMLAIVDPELSAVPGDYVIAKDTHPEVTLKQLTKDGADWFLKPLNPQYPTKDASKFEIIGVVIQAQSITKFK